MKKKSRLLVLLLSAIVTFGVLMASVERPSHMRHFKKCNNTETLN